MANINQIQLPDGSNYNLKDSVSGYASEAYVNNAVAAIDKTSVGLGNVDNTSDANKPVSAAQQAALNGKTNTSVIAYTESSAMATKRYEIGDQFILNGVLYTATAIIVNGGTITVGTNCTASDTLIEQIENVSPSADNVSFDNTGTDLVAETAQAAIVEVNAKTSGLTRMTKLWENPAPTAGFAAQTITLNSADYDYLMIVCSHSTSYPNRQTSTIVQKGYTATCALLSATGGGVQANSRIFTYSNDTTYSVATGQTATGAGSYSTADTLCVPQVIYGIKII